MTPISQMTEQELRVAVGEARGWRKEVFGPLIQDYRWHKPDGQPTHAEPPSFTTDANVAESLCNALGEKGWKFGCARHRSSGTWSVWFEMDEETSHSSVNQPTLSIAICRAYLAVVQSQTPTT